jgi:TonB-linked SusC/RagA family outer membrane protein
MKTIKIMKNIFKLVILQLALVLFCTSSLFAQDSSKIEGDVRDALSNEPLESVLISIAGENTSSDKDGKFEIQVSDQNDYLVLQIPGYTTRLLRLNGKTNISVSLVPENLKSIDDIVVTPMGDVAVRNMSESASYIDQSDMSMKANSSIDQVLQGKLNGTQVIMSSGMPGSKSYMTIRGLNSLYGRSEPLVMIDEMIHPVHYANYSAIDGFTHNTLDVVDVDDVASVSVFSDGAAYLGSNGANGIIFINTERRGETSSRIEVNAYGGIAVSPKRQDLLDADGFRNLLNEQVNSQGLSQAEIDKNYAFLNAQEGSELYYRYNNNTDWQKEIYNVGAVQKYHIFLKGGDDIATYNISTGYLMHDGILKNTSYNRFNVRINGKVNITDKFTVVPNTKVSLSDSYLMELGYNRATNPILAAQLKSPLMAPLKRDENGKELSFIDDVGAFNTSNPNAIVENVEASNRNYHFITSVKGIYKFTKNISASTFIGVDFNNSRDNIFIPDVGLIKIDSAYNSSRALVTEFRSTQNHNQLNYKKSFDENGNLDLKLGHRFMSSSYEFDKATDLNTPTDDFKSLGQGANNQEMRTIEGENRVVKWVSYYIKADYNMNDKYYLSASLSYDANSALNKESRYNIYPSLSAAWRLSSEPFMADRKNIDDWKLRLSFSQAGNINNFAYDYSHLYYRGLRNTYYSVVTRESVPNPTMEMERNTTINLGSDLTMLGQKLNVTLNIFSSMVNNLITRQKIPAMYGYTNYYNNAGSLMNLGAELSFSYRQKSGPVIWETGGNISFVNSLVTSLDFVSEENDKIVHDVEGANLVTMEANPLYSYYGFKTNGVYKDNGEASKVTGPSGQKGRAGDIRYVDIDNNNVINDLDKTVIGSPIAPLFGGLYASCAFGNFEVKADFAFSAGNDIYNHVNGLGQSLELGWNQQAEVKNRWNESNSNTDIPGVRIGDPYGNNVFSDRYLESGAFARMKSLTLSYDYPVDSPFFEAIKLYVTATNIFTLSAYSGLDPEFMLYNDPLYLSNDYGKMPQPKLFVVGVKLAL